MELFAKLGRRSYLRATLRAASLRRSLPTGFQAPPSEQRLLLFALGTRCLCRGNRRAAAAAKCFGADTNGFAGERQLVLRIRQRRRGKVYQPALELAQGYGDPLNRFQLPPKAEEDGGGYDDLTATSTILASIKLRAEHLFPIAPRNRGTTSSSSCATAAASKVQGLLQPR